MAVKINKTDEEFAELLGWVKEVLEANDASTKFNEKNATAKVIIEHKRDNQVRDFTLFDDGDTLMNNLWSIFKYMLICAGIALIPIIFYIIVKCLITM
jgi:hypothetical protein